MYVYTFGSWKVACLFLDTDPRDFFSSFPYSYIVVMNKRRTTTRRRIQTTGTLHIPSSSHRVGHAFNLRTDLTVIEYLSRRSVSWSVYERVVSPENLRFCLILLPNNFQPTDHLHRFLSTSFLYAPWVSQYFFSWTLHGVRKVNEPQWRRVNNHWIHEYRGIPMTGEA